MNMNMNDYNVNDCNNYNDYRNKSSSNKETYIHNVTYNKDEQKKFFGLESSHKATLKKVIFQLSSKMMEKACLDVLTNGFSYEQVQDPNYEIGDKEDAIIKRKRLGDLRDIMYTLPIQTLKYVESFVSITDIVTRCFIETDSPILNKESNQYIYFNEMSGKRIVYYGFVFSDYDTKAKGEKDKSIQYEYNDTQTQEKIYIKAPEGRRELLGIQPLQRTVSLMTKEIEYIAILKNKKVVFDEELVITTEYGSYDALFKSLFGLQAILLENMSDKIETSKFLHVKAPNEYFNLKPSEKNIYTEAFQKLVNGENGGIITTSAYDISLQSTSYSGSLEKTGLELLSNTIGFVTGIPQSVLFGIQQKGWSSENQEDQLKYDFFLKMLAENFFLPIMHQFCKICQLADYKKLEYKTNALIREKINIFNTEVPEELKTDERLYYIGLEIDKLIGLDSKAKAEIKKQIGVEKDGKDSNEDIKKKPNNSKNSNKSSQRNSK